VLMAIGWFWAAVGAAMVVWLMERKTADDVASVERGKDVVIRGGHADLAFAVCTLVPLAAPVFLVKACGGGGFIQGVFIVVGALFMSLATLVGLVLIGAV